MRIIEHGPNAALDCLQGPLQFAGITFNDSGDLQLRDREGRVAELPIDQVWRVGGLLARLSPEDAFRVGSEWSEWSKRRMHREECAPVPVHVSVEWKPAENPPAGLKHVAALGELRGPVALGLFDRQSGFIAVRDIFSNQASANVVEVARQGLDFIDRLPRRDAYRLGLLATVHLYETGQLSEKGELDAHE